MLIQLMKPKNEKTVNRFDPAVIFGMNEVKGLLLQDILSLKGSVMR